MGKLKTYPYDSAEYLKTGEDVANYLEAVFEDGDPALVAHALGVVARSKGMAKVAKKAGLGRESLYKALSKDGNPKIQTVISVVHAFGLKFKFAAWCPPPRAPFRGSSGCSRVAICGRRARKASSRSSPSCRWSALRSAWRP